MSTDPKVAELYEVDANYGLWSLLCHSHRISKTSICSNVCFRLVVVMLAASRAGVKLQFPCRHFAQIFDRIATVLSFRQKRFFCAQNSDFAPEFSQRVVLAQSLAFLENNFRTNNNFWTKKDKSLWGTIFLWMGGLTTKRWQSIIRRWASRNIVMLYVHIAKYISVRVNSLTDLRIVSSVAICFLSVLFLSLWRCSCCLFVIVVVVESNVSFHWFAISPAIHGYSFFIAWRVRTRYDNMLWRSLSNWPLVRLAIGAFVVSVKNTELTCRRQTFFTT